MDLIYTDRNGIEKGVLLNFSLDLECGGKNDFEISVGKFNNVLSHFDRFFIADTEYGGIIDEVKSDTKNSKIYYSGRTWRGILSKKIIRPLPGDDYFVVSGEANTIIQQMIDYLSLGEIFVADETVSDFVISNYSFNRYVNLLDGLNAMLATKYARLNIKYSDGFVELSAVPIVDYSDEIEYSSDNNVHFIAEDKKGGVNHLICLGQGELSARQVIDLYADKQGNISETQTFFGLEEIAETYDYPNVESLEELKDAGTKRLKELINSKSLDINIENLEIELYDIIAGRENITGLYVRQPITQKIIRINNGTTKIEYKVGEN